MHSVIERYEQYKDHGGRKPPLHYGAIRRVF